MTKTLLLLALALAGALSGASRAQPAAAAAAPMVVEPTDGEVRKVDPANRKITLRHGEIRNLDMPGMTMVFQVKDAALLDKVKEGDKVRFSAEKTGGAYVVTALEPAR
jgi:Cu/Ag efflux protein CusF